MSEVIYKYSLEEDSVLRFNQELETISGEIIHVGLDPLGVSCIWIQGNPLHPTTTRELYIFGTGWPMNQSHRYYHRGSWTAGELMWHLYEAKGPKP